MVKKTTKRATKAATKKSTKAKAAKASPAGPKTSKSGGLRALVTDSKAANGKARPKQGVIPGTEDKVHKEISDAAEHLFQVRSERMDLTDQEKEAANLLIKVMQKRHLAIYIDKDLGLKAIVTPEATKNATVKVSEVPRPEAAE